MADKKENDVLDHIKKAEKVIKTNLLIKQMGELKRLARELLEIKERSVMILEDVGVEEEDIKRVIDFINSSPEVQLTESDKKELREKVRREGKSKRADVQREMEQHPFLGNSMQAFTLTSGGYGSGVTTNANAVYTATAGTASLNLSNAAGDTLELDV